MVGDFSSSDLNSEHSRALLQVCFPLEESLSCSFCYAEQLSIFVIGLYDIACAIIFTLVSESTYMYQIRR